MFSISLEENAVMNERSGGKSSLVQVLDREGIRRTLARMAAEILENDGDDIVLVGIHSRGVPLAQRLAEIFEAGAGKKIPLGRIDISLYRDDVGPWRPAHSQPVLKRTELPFELDEKVVYLVDDVLYTGRTIRAALDALVDYGRPKAVRLAVLIDRGHRELPIAADVVGKVVRTSRQEDVQVHLLEFDGEDGVWAGTEVADGD